MFHAGESPLIKQTVRYDGSLIDNKLLEISLWVRLRSSHRGKRPIGFVEIRLNNLGLESRTQTSWYNLSPMEAMCGSSNEE